MSSIYILILTLFFYFDLSLLKRSNAELFHKTFRLPFWAWAIYGLLMIFLFFSPNPQKHIPAFVVITILPTYLFKRLCFKKSLPETRREVAPFDLKWTLAIDAFGVVLVWFLGVIIFVILLDGMGRLFAEQESQLGRLVVLSTFSFIFMMLLIRHVTRRYEGLSLPQILGLQRNQQSWTAMAFWPVILGLSFAIFSIYLLQTRAQNPLTPLDRLVSATSSELTFLAFFAVALLLAPLFEEMIFRGYFYYVIAENKGPLFAVLFISLIFGGLHVDQYWGDWQAIAVVILLGVVLTILRAKTGSSIPSIIMHYVYNGSMTIIPVLLLIFTNPSYFDYAVHYPALNVTQREQLLKRSIQQQPEFAPAYNDLAWLYAEEGKNLPEALALSERALAMNPQEKAFWDTKAEVLFRMGQTQEAVEIAERLVKENPSDSYLRSQFVKFRQILENP
jgi:membrane protease YdiL (CAAX protease family)